ncbi:hypothetical protein HU200_061302 [Digitaria exilis]|uniref:[RNA-polymerase]-subunit kinase n=1 Tax=Digitaria exilis TaxID=1010633 RepID=A0A835E0W4_9POAL|nr:hypothetical protein HU200_061302 [Digitaria exilis]
MVMAAAAAAATRKRPAPGGTDGATARSKRARITLGSIDDYETMEVLGEGSFGVVVKARHRVTGEAVAIKRASKASSGHLRAVLREAGCLAACRGHPSVVALRDVVEDASTGDVFLVMEFVAGATLRRLLLLQQQQQRSPSYSSPARFTEAEVRSVMRQLLRGAERMHSAGIIHRDIKPDNILVSVSGAGGVAVKICDLGLAVPARAEYPERRVGTLRYRSPEQLAGRRDYGAGVDIWALGCVMAELLAAGELLFGGADTEDAVLAMAMELGRALDDKGMKAFDEWPAFQGLPEAELSPEAREVLAGLLAVEPRDRLTATAALKHRWFAEDEDECPPAATCRSMVRAARSSSASVVTVVV